jgi:hypothetical protein
LGSDKSLFVFFECTGQDDWSQSEACAHTTSGEGGGVEVYLDEQRVGFAQRGRFELKGLAPGWHSLHILALAGISSLVVLDIYSM